MLILFFILSILIYPIMAKAQIEFQGEWPYICMFDFMSYTANSTRLPGPAKGRL